MKRLSIKTYIIIFVFIFNFISTSSVLAVNTYSFKEESSANQILEEVFPSVVNISITVSNKDIIDLELENYPFSNLLKKLHNIAHYIGILKDGGERYFKTVASGVIADATKGYIVTNHHVIKNAKDIYVTLYDKRKFKAELIGKDRKVDLVVLKINAKKLKEIKFAHNEFVKIGDFVIAIGNPYKLEYTTTFGIISGVNRNHIKGITRKENFIQTDAAINRGNSGGALINFKGELVGINTMKISERMASGFGFAIPVSTIKSSIDKFLKTK